MLLEQETVEAGNSVAEVRLTSLPEALHKRFIIIGGINSRRVGINSGNADDEACLERPELFESFDPFQ